MTTAEVGAVVKLKPERADAYGFDRGETYRVVRTFTQNGYKAVWCELEGGSMVAPLNKVPASELQAQYPAVMWMGEA